MPPGFFNEYGQKTRPGGPNPKDPWSHAKYLLEEQDDIIFDGPSTPKFHKLVGKMQMLGTVSDDTLLRLYQNDAIILTSLFDMARREPSLRMVFNVIYYGWQGELSLTRTKSGIERRMNASLGALVPDPTFQGYGENLEMPEDVLPEDSGGIGAFMQRFQPRARQQQPQPRGSF